MLVSYIPEFTVTARIVDQLREIDALRSACRAARNRSVETKLRMSYPYVSVASTVAIEGNTLGLRKVREMARGKDVEGPFDEILEARNALDAYRSVDDAGLWDIDGFLGMQDRMMWGLTEESGFRRCGVGVAKGDGWAYIAPGHEDVPPMVEKLLDWCDHSDYDPPITGAIAHYYIESIHPFEDGNGRMGRLWHHAVLHRYDPIFDLLPIEMMISRHQGEYYDVLERCQHTDSQDCTEFIEFCLDLNIESLTDLSHLKDPRTSALLSAMGDGPMTSAQIMRRMGLSSKQHFLKNYLRPAVERGFVSMSDPEHPRSCTQTYTKRIL